MRVRILEKLPILHTGRMAYIAFLFIFICDVTSSWNLAISLEIVTFGQESCDGDYNFTYLQYQG